MPGSWSNAVESAELISIGWTVIALGQDPGGNPVEGDFAYVKHGSTNYDLLFNLKNKK